ncbi:MFS transporter [Paraburkholderia oxyphila]|uniref:MFS transporter n=1 Tax=Paraburkholderia oxyphila TaxID=614212 RepID=UPI000482328C|nr:MFS transporter [Paraburkholderia oxyphila]
MQNQQNPLTKWVVLIGSAIALMVSYSPAIQQPWGIYMKPIAASFGWDRTMVTLGYSIVPLVAAPLAFVVGLIIDRVGNRGVILVQAMAIPTLLMAFSTLQPVMWQFLLVTCFGGVVNSLSTPASLTSILLQWFDKRLGMALGLSMAALGIGTALLPPLISHWIALWGWREAFRVEALILGTIGILNALLLVWDNKAVVAAKKRHKNHVAVLAGFSLRDAVAHPVFWRVVVCFFLMGMIFAGVSVHFVPIMIDQGMSPQRAAMFFGLMGIAQISGRLLCAAVLDRVKIIRFSTSIYMFTTAALALLQLSIPGREFLVPIFLGLAAGVEVDVMGLIVRRWFGMRSAARIYALGFIGFMLGASSGPLVMAFFYDRMGSYQIPMLIFTLGTVVVAWLFAGIGRYPQMREERGAVDEVPYVAGHGATS